MIIFEKIRWKNFLSTGNHPTEIILNETDTTLVIGTNGAGKSTVLDALTFTLFGKPFRKINKGQLVNTTNEKDCKVEIEFSIGDIEWKVVRGIKPNIFEIHRNGSVMDQFANVNDQQKWLEQNVLKMNYKSFTQIVILGSSNFVPFMQLTASHRREVIEDLLDIKIFSSMNDIVKNKIRIIKEDIRTLQLSKESIKDKVTMQEHFISDAETRGQDNIEKYTKKRTDINGEIADLILENKNNQESIESKQKTLESLIGAPKKLKKLSTIRGQLENKIQTIDKEHKFFEENVTCPTCDQSIEEDIRLNRIGLAQNKINELQLGFNELKDAISKTEQLERQFNQVSKEVISLTHGISQNNTRIEDFRTQSKDLEHEIQVITSTLQNRNTEHEKLNSFKKQLSGVFEKLADLKQKISEYDFVYSLLKDGGVKTSIIKKYLPLINQQVNKYLQMMDFYINFQLDEEFNETIQSPIHEDFSYSSFSEGEKMRIDLALLFTWREVARYKNSANTNLLIMDEVFDSSLDGFGTDEFLKIIRFVVKKANIFVISHKSDLLDKFLNVIKFDKVKGFSRIVE